MNGKTVIIGASPNPSRYSYVAARMLTESGREYVPVGIKKGAVFGKEILDIRSRPRIASADTVTMYIGTRNQPEWYEYVLGLKPRRIIFNPGTENHEFAQRLADAGVEVIEACTLVMLRTNQY